MLNLVRVEMVIRGAVIVLAKRTASLLACSLRRKLSFLSTFVDSPFSATFLLLILRWILGHSMTVNVSEMIPFSPPTGKQSRPIMGNSNSKSVVISMSAEITSQHQTQLASTIV